VPRITIYTGPNCPYCERAKMLLKKKGVAFEEFNVRDDSAKLEEMMQKTGGKKTVPQIFINDRYIGGSDELHALDAAGKLDPLLSA
jgi:glutaredoxin 3